MLAARSLLSFLLVVWIVAQPGCIAEEPTWEQLYKLGQSDMSKGSIDLAIAAFVTAFEKVSALGPTDPRYSLTALAVARAYRTADLDNMASLYYWKCVDIKNPAAGEVAKTVAIACREVAWMEFDKKKYKEAAYTYLQALEIWDKELGQNNGSTCGIYNDLAVDYYKQGKFDQAENAYKEAIARAEPTKKSDGYPSELMRALQNYALLLRKTEREDEAKKLEQRAERVRPTVPVILVGPKHYAWEEPKRPE